MKKLLGILIILLFLLAACGNYEGTVVEKKDSSFMVELPSGNSEVVVEEMQLIDLTTFSGDVSSFEELEVGDRVIVVPADTPSDFPYFLPMEVIVER
ncbi:YobA family protein [Planococcus glaciei]|uniref:YobA family protein n=2 Tax=Planococcus TaxID=1372 RepID=UPI001C73DBB5|nr:YobA family protein [Planococcus glaciei]MBX0314067.1 YobA family protein [Planococcus glaciei]